MEEEDKHAMGMRDVEFRKFNKQLQMKAKDRDLLKEAEQ